MWAAWDLRLGPEPVKYAAHRYRNYYYFSKFNYTGIQTHEMNFRTISISLMLNKSLTISKADHGQRFHNVDNVDWCGLKIVGIK